MTKARESTLSTHVLDTSTGVPAAGVAITLERVNDDGTARAIGSGTTDGDGRARDLLGAGAAMGAGAYRLRFATGAWFARAGRETFFPDVSVHFTVGAEPSHYHVPLLISPFGYSTYRGS